MSVFAIHVRPPRYGRAFGTVIVVTALIATTVYFGRAIRVPLTATQLDVLAVSTSPSPQEIQPTIFPAPQRVEWEGVIEGVLAGGQGLAVRRHDTNSLFQAYFPMGEVATVTEGPVLIVGQYTEISCAYATSVFGGVCTPSVEIESWEPLPIELE